MNQESKGRNALIIGVFCILVSPWLFTSFSFIDFTNTGEIGDTIGGISAPITSFLGAYLVYLALLAQVKANNAVYKQFEKQELKEREDRLYNSIQRELQSLNSDIDNLYYQEKNRSRNTDERVFRSVLAIEKTLEDVYNYSFSIC